MPARALRAALQWLALAALLVAVLAASPARTPHAAARPRASTPPALELVESVPIETSLGNPALRQAANVWLELVHEATANLDFEEFYLSTWPGEPTEPLLRAIVEAAKRGVRVRLLLDARMHRTYPQPADSLGKIPGITVRTIDFGKVTGGVQHAKFFLVDGRTVYLGSQNFDWRALKHIHELGVLVRDERVAELFQPVFEMDWGTAELQASAPDSGRMIAVPPPASVIALPVPVVQSPGDTVALWPSWSPRSFSPDSTRWDRDAVTRAIDSAEHEIVAQSLHYSTGDSGSRDETLDQALRRAAARGVQVRLVISDWELGGSGMQALHDLASVPNVQVKVSRVPEWSGGYVPFARVEHCKYMVVDSLWTWVGTANWEPGYFHRLRNVAVTLRNRPIALEARRVFAASWQAPSALPLTATAALVPRNHGATAPAGVRKYGE